MCEREKERTNEGVREKLRERERKRRKRERERMSENCKSWYSCHHGSPLNGDLQMLHPFYNWCGTGTGMCFPISQFLLSSFFFF